VAIKRWLDTVTGVVVSADDCGRTGKVVILSSSRLSSAAEERGHCGTRSEDRI